MYEIIKTIYPRMLLATGCLMVVGEGVKAQERQRRERRRERTQERRSSTTSTSKPYRDDAKGPIRSLS